MNFLITVLTSKDEKKLDRCLSSIPTYKHDTVVICNTTLPKYYAKANKICTKHNVKMVVTESNGTPGLGKNSVLDYFLQNKEYDYVIPIDGDDYFFPNGVDKIVEIITQDATIDVLGLTNTFCTKNKKIYNLTYYEENFLEPPRNTDLTQFFSFLELFNTHFDNDLNTISKFHRIVVQSRLSAKLCRYDTTLMGCEDMLYSLQLKKLDLDKKLNFKLFDSTNEKIHCYDINNTENGCSGMFLQRPTFEKRCQYLNHKAVILKNSIRHKILYI